MGRPRFFYGWVIAATCFLSLGLTGGTWYSFSVFFVAIQQEFGGGRGDTALAFSLNVITQGILNPFVGTLVERFGIRRVMPLGALFLTGALVACALVTAPWQYYLAFGLLMPIGTCSIGSVPSYTVLNRWFVKRRGLALGISSAGIGGIGIFAIVPLAQYFVATIGWRHSYLVLAATVAMLLPIVSLLLLRERPQDLGLLPDGAPATTASRSAERESMSAITKTLEVPPPTSTMTVSQAVRTERFWMVLLANLLMATAIQSVFVHQIAYFLDLGHSPVLAAAAVGLIGLISIPMKIGSGWLSDRLGRSAVYSLGGASLIVSFVLLLLMPQMGGVWLLYVFVAFFSIGYATQNALYPAVAGDLFSGRHLGTIFGLLNSGQNMGSALGAWLAGYLFDIGGSYAPAFMLNIIAMALACTVLWSAMSRSARLPRPRAHPAG